MIDHQATRRRDDKAGKHRLPACRFRQLAEGWDNETTRRPNDGTGEGCRSTTQHRHAAFTLVELLVSVGVLVLLVLLFTQLLNSAATITTLGHKQMDADSQARQLLDRMAIDFAQMVKRNDVSYYVKTAGNPQLIDPVTNPTGNDQIAFFSLASGYYPTPSFQSPASLIAYRVNSDSSSSNLARSYNKLERMGKGFIWNGVSSSYIPILFLDGATPPANTIANIWPSAASSSTADADYEIAGPQVFRFEYYYLLSSALSANALSNGAVANKFSGAPWSDVNSFVITDVAAIVVEIAAIDPKSKVLLTDAQIATLAGGLSDFPSNAATAAAMVPGQLRANWQTALDANTSLPRPAISGIRVYERYFYLSPPTLLTP
jgi:type II secretory pathway pseudopilin PulG